MKQGSDLSKTTDAIASITKAVIESVKALHDDTESATAVGDDEDNLSIKSFDSNEPAIASRPASPRTKKPLPKKREIADRPHSSGSSYQIFVRGLDCGTHAFQVTSDFRVGKVMEMVEEVLGIPPVTQRLIWDGNRLDSNRALAQVCRLEHLNRCGFALVF